MGLVGLVSRATHSRVPGGGVERGWKLHSPLHGASVTVAADVTPEILTPRG